MQTQMLCFLLLHFLMIKMIYTQECYPTLISSIEPYCIRNESLPDYCFNDCEINRFSVNPRNIECNTDLIAFFDLNDDDDDDNFTLTTEPPMFNRRRLFPLSYPLIDADKIYLLNLFNAQREALVCALHILCYIFVYIRNIFITCIFD